MYESLLKEKMRFVQELARKEGFTLDTRTASMIFFALAANAFETGQAYIELEQVLNESFADTETRDFLIRRARERGLTVEPATFAVRKGEFNIDIPIGSRFSLNKLNYRAIAPVDGGANAFQMKCETAGYIGNLESGALIPIEYIEGLTFAKLTEVLIPGEDEEDTESLRQRYMDSLNALAYGGNVQDYVQKTLSLDGVGGVKVYPVWQGGGTVRLAVLDSQYNPPSETLLDAVQTVVDPVPNQGLGLGVAPIGHAVTVTGVIPQAVDIALNMTFKDGWDFLAVKPYAEQTVDEYFTELASGWDKVDWRNDQSAALVVRISQIETRLLSLPGVLDIQNTLLNSKPENFLLLADGIPARGTIEHG